MNFETLASRGLIKPFKASTSQIKNRIDLAKRDIKAARATMAHDRDWAFSIAYNAILQATRALMFDKGFRPAAGGGSTRPRFNLRKLHWAINSETIYIFLTK